MKYILSIYKKIDLISLQGYISRMFVLGKKTALFLIAITAAVFLSTGTVEAQKRRGIVLEEIKIEGTIQKPEVMHFLSRAKFTYRTLDLDVTFTEKVEKALYVDEAF